MRRKALDGDYLRWLVMSICEKLGKSEHDLKDWSLDDVIRWAAYFSLKRKAEKKAYEKAAQEAKRASRR